MSIKGLACEAVVDLLIGGLQFVVSARLCSFVYCFLLILSLPSLPPSPLPPSLCFLLPSLPPSLPLPFLPPPSLPPRMVRLYQKIEKAVKQLDYFTQNDWNVSQRNLQILTCLISLLTSDSYTHSHTHTHTQWSHRNSDKLLSLLSEHDREVSCY